MKEEWAIQTEYETEDGIKTKTHPAYLWGSEEKVKQQFWSTNWEGRTVHLVRREVTEWERVDTREHSGEVVIESEDDYEDVILHTRMKK